MLIFVLLFTAGASPADLLAQGGSKVRQSYSESPPAEGSKRPSSKAVKISGVDFRAFTALCAAIAADGRYDTFFGILQREVERERDIVGCPVCKPLMRRLASICKDPLLVKQEREAAKAALQEKAAKRNAKLAAARGQPEIAVETPPPTPTPAPRFKQREPHSEVIQLTSSFFTTIAQLRNAREFVPFVDYYERLLRQEKGRSAAEVGYLGTIADYMKIPFNNPALRAPLVQEQEPGLFGD